MERNEYGNPVVGYEVAPPTIVQFLNGEEYLKRIFYEHLFPFWVEKLKEIFPNQIETEYPVVVLKGGYGTGKTTAARIIAEYNKCRILSLSDPNKVLGITSGDSIEFKYINRLSSIAKECFSDVINEWEDLSPFFNKMKESGKENLIKQITGGMYVGELNSDPALFYSFSEMDFSKDETACERLIGEAKKWKSKFGSISKYFGGFVVDAISSECDCVVEKIQEIFGNKVLVINTNQWGVREGYSDLYGKKGWFKVYAGDELIQPFIVDDSHPINDEMSKEKVIEVPEELRPNFEASLESSLKYLAGVSLS